MKARSVFAATLLILALTLGCSSVPQPASTHAPSGAAGAFVEMRDNAVTAASPPARWWQLFADPVLDAHIERALAANTDVRVAFANLEVARASAREARAARLPSFGAESGAGGIDAVDQPSTTMISTTDYQIGATVAYEVDLFGKWRQFAQAARADLAASTAALDVVRMAIAADTALAYVAYCGTTASAALARVQIATQQRSLDLVTRQLEEGEVSPLVLAQSRTSLRAAEANLPVHEAAQRRALFQLAVLQGRPPAAADALQVSCDAVPVMAAAIPVGDGAALLARRPDIREAEARLAAATARIGVATADLYPRIQLGASAGQIRGQFDAFLTPLISWTFLDRNGARARIAAARGKAAAALATWDGVMLRAMLEVESALATYRAERTQQVALTGAIEAAQEASRLAQMRFRLGAESYLVVLDALRTHNDLAMQTQASQLRVAQIQIALLRALGGSWSQTATQ